jgi:hypothetical protein
MLLRRSILLPAALIAAQSAPIFAETPARQSTLIVYGNDPCPRATADNEAVVCARRPEGERYRIPAPLRRRPDRPSEVSWASRVEGLDDASRPMRPNSCSVVGSYGQSGCTQAMIRQWYAERRQQRADDAGVP